VPPSLVRPTRRFLGRGRRSPRRGDGRLSRARPSPRHDVGPVKRVSSVAIGPVQPPPPSRRHLGHCSAIPDAVGVWGTRHHRARCCAPHDLPSATPSSQSAGDDRTEDTYPPPSKPLLEGYRVRHDIPPEARFARTAVYSTALFATPSHIARTVWHACKLPPPYPIKGGAVPWPQGDDRQHSHARFLPSPRY
jgi:hypothetical protein